MTSTIAASTTTAMQHTISALEPLSTPATSKADRDEDEQKASDYHYPPPLRSTIRDRARTGCTGTVGPGRGQTVTRAAGRWSGGVTRTA